MEVTIDNGNNKEQQNEIENEEILNLNIPQAAWKRKLDKEFENHKEFSVSAWELMSLAFFAYRVIRYGQLERAANRIPVIDPLEKKFEDPIFGVPLGGLGGGAICRGWRGDFVRWSIFPASIVKSGIVHADQFSFFSSDSSAPVRTPSTKRSSIKRKVVLTNNNDSKRLSADNSSSSGLSQSPPDQASHMKQSITPTTSPHASMESFPARQRTKLTTRSQSVPVKQPQVNAAPVNTNKQATVMHVPSKKYSKPPIYNCWNFNGLKGTKSHYYGLFPQAWTVYDCEPDPDLLLTCHQVSPVIPNDYERSSYPATVFTWKIENLSRKYKNASLMFTFQNGNGSEMDAAGGHYNQVHRQEFATHEIVGIKMNYNYERVFKDNVVNDPVSFMIATKIDYDEFGAGIIESARNVIEISMKNISSIIG